MQDADHNPYETGYDAPTLPYVPPPSEQTTYRGQALPITPLPEVYGHEDGQTEPYAMPLASVTPASLPEIERPKRKRRTLWIVLAGVVALLVIVSLAAYQFVTYINRPTPNKALDAFCTGLLHSDYHSAYGQFSKGIQVEFSEAAFTSDIEQDKIVSCSHGDASDAGSSASTNLRLVHSSKGINKDIVVLIRDSANNWKINDLRKQV